MSLHKKRKQVIENPREHERRGTPMADFDMAGLFAAMSFVVMERLDDGSVQVIGTVPRWFRHLYPNVDMESGILILEKKSSFLELFIEEAQDFWTNNEPGHLTSDIWTETDLSGNECALEASAICFGGKEILIIQLLGATFKKRQTVFQRVREVLLDKEAVEQIVTERTAELRKTTEDLKKTLDNIVHVLALTVEVRDPYTAGHQKGVADLARAIAIEMGLPEGVVESIYVAGAIHDVGKISVPVELLSKPSPLTKDELSLIRIHSQVGYDILKDIPFPWAIALIVLQHHERMDGSGYPQGLSGESITLEARILTVADVVETMASHRPYRPALGIEMALAEIKQNRGVLYDPNVVDACVRLFSEKGYQGIKIKNTDAWMKKR